MRWLASAACVAFEHIAISSVAWTNHRCFEGREQWFPRKHCARKQRGYLVRNLGSIEIGHRHSYAALLCHLSGGLLHLLIDAPPLLQDNEPSFGAGCGHISRHFGAIRPVDVQVFRHCPQGNNCQPLAVKNSDTSDCESGLTLFDLGGCCPAKLGVEKTVWTSCEVSKKSLHCSNTFDPKPLYCVPAAPEPPPKSGLQTVLFVISIPR